MPPSSSSKRQHQLVKMDAELEHAFQLAATSGFLGDVRESTGLSTHSLALALLTANTAAQREGAKVGGQGEVTLASLAALGLLSPGAAGGARGSEGDRQQPLVGQGGAAPQQLLADFSSDSQWHATPTGLQQATVNAGLAGTTVLFAPGGSTTGVDRTLETLMALAARTAATGGGTQQRQQQQEEMGDHRPDQTLGS